VDDADLAYLSLDAVSRRLLARDISPVEITRTLIERTARLQPRLGAYITFTPERALEAARRAERELLAGDDRGPLHGVPVAVKDHIAISGVPSTFGSRAFANYVPDQDSAAVERLRRAGAILLGTTNLPELCWAESFQNHAFAIPRNPWNPDHHPGVSSPGSAIVVAAGLAYGAVGSDTGGSIRNPAAACGITGLKPTYGRISLYGVQPLAPGLDHLGPIARSALDCALLLDALAGHDARDPDSLTTPIGQSWAASLAERPHPLKIGVPRAFFWEDLQPDVAGVAERALDVWRDLGWELHEITLPPLAPVAAAALTVHEALTGAEHAHLLTERPDDLTPEARQRFAATLQIAAVDYLAARRACNAFAATLADTFREVDLLVTPTLSGTAPRMAPDGALLEPFPAGPFRGMFNPPGVPAISIPCGFSPRGLPVGLQLIAPRLAESTLLSAAHAFQQSTDHHLRHPPLD
jgi:aspartyl-tRNA(Asn)/glutamyl-tRNA(Gln) amidotransferase subunit A